MTHSSWSISCSSDPRPCGAHANADLSRAVNHCSLASVRDIIHWTRHRTSGNVTVRAAPLLRKVMNKRNCYYKLQRAAHRSTDTLGCEERSKVSFKAPILAPRPVRIQRARYARTTYVQPDEPAKRSQSVFSENQYCELTASSGTKANRKSGM